MANSLRFIVEIDANHATGQLDAIVQAVNKASGTIKTQFKKGTSEASGGFLELKKSAGRARETAMFFTQALGEFGPTGRTAQIAISGVAGAIMGGGGVLLALGLAQAAVRLLVDAWQEEAKAEAAAKKAAEETAKAQAEAARVRMGVVRDVYASAQKTNAELKAQLRGLNDQEIADAEEIKRLKREILFLDGAQLAAAQKRLDQVLAIQAENAELRRQLELKKGLKDVDAAAAKAEADRKDPSKWGVQYGPPEAPAAEQKSLNNELEKSAALSAQWGDVLGNTFAQLAMGQMSAEQATKSILQLLIKEATAAAIASAIQAGKSQAGTPVIGPVLAISAMGAILAATTSMIGGMPSARGGWWDTGAYEGLAMIHKKEMVLPAREAEMVRKGAGGVTLNVAAYDARGFDRVLSNNNSALAREMRKMNRRGSM